MGVIIWLMALLWGLSERMHGSCSAWCLLWGKCSNKWEPRLLDAWRAPRGCVDVREAAALNPTQSSGHEKQMGVVSTLWEGNNPALRSCGNGVVLGGAQAQHPRQGSPGRGLTRQKPVHGNEESRSGWMALPMPQRRVPCQLPGSFLPRRIDFKSRGGWWGPGVAWAAPFLRSLTDCFFLLLTWQRRKHKIMGKWIIERRQFEFSPRQMCLKRLFPQREVLRFQYSILPNKLQNFLSFILVACLSNYSANPPASSVCCSIPAQKTFRLPFRFHSLTFFLIQKHTDDKLI